MENSYQIKILTLAGLPTIHLYRDDNEPKPLVIFGHSFRQSVKQNINLLYQLAEAGFYAFALDAENHGYRISSETGPIPPALDDPWTADLFYNALLNQSDEVVAALSALAEKRPPDANLTRIGALGTSMGGYLSFHLAARLEAVKAACPLLATPEWKFEDSWSGVGLKPATEKRVRENSPHLNPAAYTGKAIQTHNGTQDELIPIASTRAFYHQLTSIPGCRAEMHTYICGHEVTRAMVRRSLAFLTEELKPPATVLKGSRQ